MARRRFGSVTPVLPKVLHRRRPRTVTSICACLVLAAAAGCSGASSGAPATAPTTSTVSTTPTTPAGTAPPTTTPVPTTTGPTTTGPTTTGPATPSRTATAAGVPRCTAGQLRIRAGRSDGAAGSIYLPVVFHNSGARCALQGHPGMDATGPGGTVHAARDGRSSTGSAAVRRVVLASGGDASALIRASDVPSGSATTCPGDFTRLLLTPPDLTRSTSLAARLPACPGLEIGPVVPGTRG